MKYEKVSVTTNDGPMNLHVHSPAEGSKNPPAILILHEAYGVNENMQSVAKKFAEMGYLAVIPDLFHRITDDLEIPYGDPAKVMPILGSLVNEEVFEDVKAAYLYLKGTRSVPVSSIGAIGFCMGGFAAMLGACRLPLHFAISCYGGGISNERPGIGLMPFTNEFKGIKCPVFLLYGEEDHSITPDQIETVRGSLRRVDKEYEIKVYLGAGHAFLREGQPVFNAAAAEDAWKDIFSWLGLQKKS